MASKTPMTDALRSKITEALQPTHLEIHNDSHKHQHHSAMAGNTSLETHFRLVIISEAFKSKLQPARHRMVYALMKDELARKGGIHALQLKTRTPDETQEEQNSEEVKQ
ncbi:BolA-like protein 1 [Golovinomyces cichoracearum]|uniref:BolA-like protein 1 n=1 Tax=Golovinomyces cichoracearum TaxID=62708 RepID=A0A420ID63_9PEZI|nr:BolA-like protein 1 [Golovinomyces cichoracearum]